MITEVQPVRIFIAYAHEDATSRERLRIHLNVLQRRGLCHIFWDGLILPGERWDDRLKDELRRANIFLLLVSEHFLDSDYVHEVELPKALELQKQGKAEVLPVILRNCLWRHTELVDFQCILHRGEPIEETNGFAHVADLVAETAFQLNAKRAAEIRAQQEIEDQEQAIMAAAEEARKQRLAAFESARTEADALYSKKQWQAAFEAYNLTLQLLEPDFPDTAKRLQTRLRGCEIGIGKERKQQKEKAENAVQVAREQQIREQADHDLWEFVEETDAEAGYKKYLQKYPDGLHAAEARGKLDKFDRQHEEAERKKQQQAADISAWQVAEKADTESAYKKYLQQYPEGLYAVQAHRRQQALLLEAEAAAQKQREEEETARKADHEAWELAKDVNSEPSYKEYLQKYPIGLYATKARDILGEFTQQRKETEYQRKQEASEKRDMQTTAQKKIYAGLPNGNILHRLSDQFEPLSTFFVIEVNIENPTIGKFLLVDDSDTLRHAASLIGDLRDACELRSIGIPTKNVQVIPGKVKLEGRYWIIVQKIILTW